jgi:glucosamine 6-phosphate synthetase-like amidotransferase/phosphosugar isomerase protein
MKTIEAYENDILLQIPFLQNTSFPKQLSIKNQQKTIFCGSGDSLAAALLVESFSNNRARVTDPLDLIKNTVIAKNKEVYFVSISGKTISNVKAAKLFKKTFAITSNQNSNLAKICSKKILLNYPNSGIFTSGSIGFLASALTCISLVSKLRIHNTLELFKQALIESKKIKIGKNIFILGNFHTFPIAMYGAAKFYELLGSRVQYCRIEQFLHMEIFSIETGDTVIIFEEKNLHNSKIIRKLKKLGLRVYQPNSGTRDKISHVIFYTFFSQLAPLFYAKKNKQKECYFVTAKKLRNVSSILIY